MTEDELREIRRENMRKAREARMANIAQRKERKERKEQEEETMSVPEGFDVQKAIEEIRAAVEELKQVHYHIPRYVCAKCGRDNPNARVDPGEDARIQCIGCTNSGTVHRPIILFGTPSN